MAIREKTLGPSDLDIAQSLNNLAVLFRDQGDFASARRDGAKEPRLPASLTSIVEIRFLFQPLT